jgi:hypothetical protein
MLWLTAFEYNFFQYFCYLCNLLKVFYVGVELSIDEFVMFGLVELSIVSSWCNDFLFWYLFFVLLFFLTFRAHM